MGDNNITAAFRGEVATEGTVPEDILAEEIRTALKSVRIDTEWLSIKKQSRKLTPQFTAGEKPENAKYNRKSLPNDETRVVLSAASGDATQSYVNANKVPGWGNRNYIVAESPLPDNIGSLWRIVVEHNVQVMVGLVPVHVESVPRSWPKPGQPVEYDGITVTTEGEEQLSSGLRMARISLQTYADHHNMLYFVYEWPEPEAGPVPQDADSVATFVDTVNSIAGTDDRPDQPFLVHCFDGQGASGVFVAHDIALRRLAAIHALDVPAIVMYLRKHRNGMVPTVKHFRFLYEMLLPGAEQRAKKRRETKTEGLGRRLSRKFSVEDFAESPKQEPEKPNRMSLVTFDQDAEYVQHESNFASTHSGPDDETAELMAQLNAI